MESAYWRGLRRAAFAATAAIALAGLIGCGGSGGGSGNGTLQVRIADGPDPTITSISVTIDRVEAHVNNTWMTLNVNNGGTFDLMSLIKDSALLASGQLPAGHYTQMRLFPSSATVTDSTGTHNVTIPSGVQTGVKLNVDFDLSPDQTTTILLDFNVHKSLVKQGNGQYLLQPVIPVVVLPAGTVTGVVVQNGGAPAVGADIVVSGGRSETSTFSVAPDGSFKIWALLPGTYTLDVTWVDSGSVTHTAQVTGVVVAAGADKNVGTITLSP